MLLSFQENRVRMYCGSGSDMVVMLCSKPHLVSNLSVADVDHF